MQCSRIFSCVPTLIKEECKMEAGKKLSAFVVGAVVMSLLLGTNAAQAAEVIFEPDTNRAIRIENLQVGATLDTVTFDESATAASVYGAYPGTYTFTDEPAALEALEAVTDALQAADATSVGESGQSADSNDFYVGFEGTDSGIERVRAVRGQYVGASGWVEEGAGSGSNYNEDLLDWAVFSPSGPAPPVEEPQADFSFSPSDPLVDQAVKFTDTSGGGPGETWEWDFDDGETSTQQNPSHSFNEEGTYDVKLTVTNSAGSSDAFMGVTVSSNESEPEASFSFSPAEPGVDEAVKFTDTSGGGAGETWEWDFDDGEYSTQRNPTHSFDAEGRYDVSLTVTNSAGQDTAQMTVDVKDTDPIDPDFDHAYFVPSASHAAGAEGSFWVTDVDVNNSGDDTATFRFAWLPRKADNSDPAKSEEFTLEPGESVRFEDVVLSIFDIDDGYGALAVAADSSDLFIFSRTYNDTDLGTFGTAVPGVAESDLVQGSIRKRLLFLTEDSDFRSNIAFQNGISSNLRVKWERFLADGTMVESGTTDLAPYSNKQLNAIYGDEAPVEAAYMDVWTDTVGGKFMVFSSVVDNGTSDGTVVQPQW